ncbi:MAG: hypothetical protein AB7O29_01180, partial [Acidimicrobiia bacterium]
MTRRAVPVRDRTPEREDGSALIMVLVFVVAIGVIVGATLDLASAGLHVSARVAELRVTNLAVESAVDGAVNSIRNSNQLGLPGTDGQCGPFVRPADGDDPEVVVECSPEPVPGAADDQQPPFSVLTLGTGDGEGFVKSGNATLTVEGGIFSHGRLEAAQGPVQVIGDAVARGACSGAVTATGTNACSIGGGAYPTGDDPGYPAAVGGVGDLDDIDPEPECVGSARVKFLPGLYSERPKRLLEQVVATDPGLPCAGAPLWWFSPGAYYFDFPDDDAVWDPQADGVSVVGGTFVSATIPGACDPDPAQAGVQFVFGGQSRLENTNTDGARKVELCAGPNPGTDQRIAVYGLTSGARETIPASGHQERVGTAASATAPFAADQAGRALADDGSSITATFPRQTGGSSLSGSVTVSGFADIPDGAHVVVAILEIQHSETGQTGQLDVGATWTSANGTVVGCAFGTGPNRTESCDITDAIREGVDAAEFNGISSATFTATRGNGGPAGPGSNAVVSLDVVRLLVRYVAPGFEAHTCPSVTIPPSCSLLTTTGNNNTIFLHGTVYAPTAAIR